MGITNDTVITLDRLDTIRAAFHKAILEEALGSVLPELKESGWTQMGGGSDAATGLNRQQVNEEAWRYYNTDPIARHLVRLNNAYTFARGVSVRASDPDLDKWLKKFWNHPRNRDSISRAKAQWRLGRDMQLKGEVFFVFYTSTLTGRVTVRTLPPEQIASIEYADGDTDTPLVFNREYTKDGKTIKQSLPDYRVAGEPYKPDATTEMCVMHVIGNELNGRGISDLTTAIPWIKALKGFMEDRATLTLALATFAFRQKVKGNRQSLERVAAQWGTYETALRYGDGDGRERRQAANTIVENEASNLDQIKTDSGASNAYQDMRMFRQQAGIGAGAFEHYLGDPSTGNLATATAMELPMLKLFEFGQSFWGDVFEEMLEFVIRQGVRYNTDLRGKAMADVDNTGGTPTWLLEPEAVKGQEVDLSTEAVFPPIVQSDIAVWSTALAQIKQAEMTSGQQVLPAEQTAQLVLRIFGYGPESQAILAAMKENGFTLPVSSHNTNYSPQQPSPGQPTTEALAEADPGKALPKKEADKVAPVTKKEIEKAFDDWEKLPSLEDLAKELGLTLEELDDA